MGVVKDFDLTNPATLVVGAAAVGLLLLMRFKAPKLPRAFIVVILGILAVSWFDLTEHGVEVVGDVPTGTSESRACRRGFSVSEWLSMAWARSRSSSSATASRSPPPRIPRRDTGRNSLRTRSSSRRARPGSVHPWWAASPGCGSLSKTAVAEGSGQKTQLAGLTVAGLTVLTLLFLAGMFSNLPQAVLGAVVIDAALGLIHFKVAARFFVASRRDFLVFVGTAIGLFFVGVVAGIVFGVVVSLLLLISRTSKSPLRRMAYDPEDQVYVEADTHPDATTPDGVLVVK